MISNPQNTIANDAVDVVNCGLFHFVDGRLSTANRKGRALLKDGFLVIANDQLMCTQPHLNRQLQSFVAETSKTQETPLILRDPQSKSEYCIRLHKAQSSTAITARGSATIVSVTRLRPVEPPTLPEVRIFAGSYALSEAEIHVLHAVLGATELRKLAVRRGVNLDTVRKQLKSAMAKVEVSSQKELFALFERFRFCGS